MRRANEPLLSLPSTASVAEGSEQARPIDLLIGTVVLALVVAACGWLAPEPVVISVPVAARPDRALDLGSQFPRFSLLDDRGHTITDRDLQGRPQVVLFVSNCSQCSAGTVMTWSSALEGTGYRLVVMAPVTPEVLRAFRRSYAPHAVLLSTGALNLARTFGLSRLPVAYALSRRGKVTFVQRQYEDARAAAERVLQGLGATHEPGTP